MTCSHIHVSLSLLITRMLSRIPDQSVAEQNCVPPFFFLLMQQLSSKAGLWALFYIYLVCVDLLSNTDRGSGNSHWACCAHQEFVYLQHPDIRGMFSTIMRPHNGILQKFPAKNMHLCIFYDTAHKNYSMPWISIKPKNNDIYQWKKLITP